MKVLEGKLRVTLACRIRLTSRYVQVSGAVVHGTRGGGGGEGRKSPDSVANASPSTTSSGASATSKLPIYEAEAVQVSEASDRWCIRSPVCATEDRVFTND